MEMDIEIVPVDQLVPYYNNPRLNNDAVDAVANSIKEFGFKQPIVIDKDNVIIAGHTRWEASQELGLTEVPIIRADDLTEEQIKAYRIADNKTAELADWDLDKLELEMMDLDDNYMSQFGFDFEIEGEAETEEEQQKEKRIKQLELKSFEHHDYLVFVFDNQQDWLSAVSKFDIERVDAGYGDTKKVGVGRVLNGKELLEKI